MESHNNRVRVNIYGEEYTVRSDGNMDYITEVADYVDKKMRDIAEKMPNKSPARVAVLAALNITDELLQERQGGERDLSDIEKRTSDILSILDEKLPED
ncbi:MAG: cell division protein ZapA [candidate division Zixibacteria bacterium]|nr:cell division protein ZapA [candidate division Zixibacteria bacterium]